MIQKYHNGKISRNEIVLCELSFERSLGRNKKEIIVLPRVIYKYYKGLLISIRHLSKYKIPNNTVTVLDIDVIERMGFGVDEG